MEMARAVTEDMGQLASTHKESKQPYTCPPRTGAAEKGRCQSLLTDSCEIIVSERPYVKNMRWTAIEKDTLLNSGLHRTSLLVHTHQYVHVYKTEVREVGLIFRDYSFKNFTLRRWYINSKF